MLEISKLDLDQQDQIVTVYDTYTEETHPVKMLWFSKENDPLELNHPLLSF